MDVTIKINTNNRAFQGKVRSELARILNTLAIQLEYGEIINRETKLPLIDSNGNIAGYLTVKESE